MRTFWVLVLAYVAITGAVLLLPHTHDGFGKIQAHQFYARAGIGVSFALVDRTLVDWYMMGPTLEDNIPHYDPWVHGSVLRLTPFYVLWCAIAALAYGLLRERLQNGRGV